jgi:hypothetical protein
MGNQILNNLHSSFANLLHSRQLKIRLASYLEDLSPASPSAILTENWKVQAHAFHHHLRYETMPKPI